MLILLSEKSSSCLDTVLQHTIRAEDLGTHLFPDTKPYCSEAYSRGFVNIWI